jgi:transitional endoplasmic reticulum ATPase
LLTNPRVVAIELPMPDQPSAARGDPPLRAAMPPAEAGELAGQTAGLRLIQLASIVASEAPQGLSQGSGEADCRTAAGQPEGRRARRKAGGDHCRHDAGRNSPDRRSDARTARDDDPAGEVLAVVRQRKRELIEKECAGLIEFIEPRHGLETVGGNEHIKGELLDIARLIQSGDRTRAPMGLLAVGPMGAGKTFVIKAFLKEAGLSGVALKNFRSKWVGSTEANLERVLATVKAMGPIALVIDEGDRSFGRQGDDADGGTSSRVIARLKEFMSDPENRGQVLFILMTNRPDKLDTDIKRPGRLDRKIPFFYAENAAERAAVISAVCARYRVPLEVPDDALLAACETLEGYSNADLEALALLAAEFAERGARVADGTLPPAAAGAALR